MAQHPLGTTVDLRSSRLIKAVDGAVGGGLISSEGGKLLKSYARSVRTLLEAIEPALARQVLSKIEDVLAEEEHAEACTSVRKKVEDLERAL